MEHCALCIPSLFCLILVVSSSSPPQWKSFPNPRPSGASKAPIPKSSTALVSSSTWRFPAAPGRESSIVAEIVEVEENSTDYMQTLRRPPVITIHKSPAYAIYLLIHNIRVMMLLIDLSEYSVKTRKCEPDALKECDEIGHVIEHSEEVILGPENRTATSEDKFLRVNLIGDFVGYSSIPSFEDLYLVLP
ncbi:unnamed protein product [Linum tenue]|uniref:Generative cell specific-1/HAP2 domain-containing protein n=1 Tax=Linum tenue TaxID=586396 RepID=A0AAV0K1Q8_9ROSI|nr:unnamed protein product [Linum tenue]